MTAHTLALLPTVIAGEPLANDYSVFRSQNNQLIGRIRMLDERTWGWTISVFVPEPATASGTEKSLERAKTKFLVEWIKFNKTLTSGDVAFAVGTRH
jgi:hypothetical protein